jgi:CRP-like cAMP-binding protein
MRNLQQCFGMATAHALLPDLPEQVFAARGWLSSVPADIRHQILAAAEPRRFEAGESIASAGQEGGGPFGLLQGRVGCWGASPFTDPTLGYVAIPGDWFGEGPALLGITRTLSFRALERSTLLYLPAVRMRQMADAEPGLQQHFARLSETAAQLMAGLISELLIPNTERRLAILLVRAARTVLDTGPTATAPLPLGQAQLGELVGTSRAQINRILRGWAAQGLVETGYNSIRPRAIDRLEAIASNS